MTRDLIEENQRVITRGIMRRLTFSALILLGAACKSGGAAAPAASPATTAPAGNPVVARIDGQEIRAGEVDDLVRGGLIRAEVQYHESRYELRKQALDEIINERLVQRKAKAEGLDADKLLERDVHSKVPAATDTELRTIYDQAKQGGEELPPFDAIKPEVARYVRQQRLREALDGYHEKLRAEAKIETSLPPPQFPRIAVEAVGPTMGGADAPVTIVAFSDYECPFCKRAEPAVKSVVEAYGGKVRLVYKEYPLPNHRFAQKASEAALCAHDQGKYWEMQDKLFANQEALGVPSLKGYAKQVGLDTARFDRCLDGGDKAEAVAASMRAGDDAGVAGTPAFFVNGRPLYGAASFEKFKEVIDAELEGKQ
jgi:protein-disulfide isomerase